MVGWTLHFIPLPGAAIAARPSASWQNITSPTKRSTLKSTPGAADAVIQNVGKRAIPQFVIDGKWVQPYKPGQGFLHEEMAELFGVSE